MSWLSLRKRIGGKKKSSILPDGYTLLDSVENTSDSHINDNTIYIDNDDVIEIDFTPSSYSGLKFICGTNAGAGTTKFFLATTLQQWQYRPSHSYTFAAGTRYNVKLGSGIFVVNGEFQTIQSGNIEDTPFSLFTDTSSDTRRFLGKIHSFKVDGKINLIPCISPTNVVGFYNAVTGRFYGSQSTNPFVGG